MRQGDLQLATGMGGPNWAFIVKNTSGATANAGDVGYLDDNNEYQTTTTAEGEQPNPVAVIHGGANNADIYVTEGPGRLTINYIGSAPSTGDFLTFSTTAGKVQARSTMHPGIVARARDNGNSGTVEVELLLRTKQFIIAATNDVYSSVISVGANRAGDSDFVALIDSLPGGAAVRYDTPTSGHENSLIPDNTSVLAKLTLHNTTRGDSALISDSSNAGGAGYDGEITLTASVPAGWTVGDTITIRSQTNTSTMQDGYFVDFEIADTSAIPELARAIEMELTIVDTGGTGLATRVHPFEANDNSKRKGCQCIVSGLNHQNTLNVVVPLINRKFCAVWNASGSNTAIFALKLNKVFVAA